MRGRTVFLIAVVLGGVEAWGCSSSNSGTGSSGGLGSDAGPVTYVASGACNGKDVQCLPLRCTCDNGTSHETTSSCRGGQCVDESSECTQLCGDAGVTSVAPVDNVIGSNECNAFCDKASSECPGTTCDQLFFCSVAAGECEASTRAFLQCEVDTGTWACSKGGNGWSVGSTCDRHTDLCGGDGG